MSLLYPRARTGGYIVLSVNIHILVSSQIVTKRHILRLKGCPFFLVSLLSSSLNPLVSVQYKLQCRTIRTSQDWGYRASGEKTKPSKALWKIRIRPTPEKYMSIPFFLSFPPPNPNGGFSRPLLRLNSFRGSRCTTGSLWR